MDYNTICSLIDERVRQIVQQENLSERISIETSSVAREIVREVISTEMADLTNKMASMEKRIQILRQIIDADSD